MPALATKSRTSKRYRAASALVPDRKPRPIEEAVKLLKQMPTGKADQTIDLAFRLGVDPNQSDQMVRGTVALPHGSGKHVRVLVFATGAAAEAAKSAGAEHVGYEDLIKQVTGGFSDFDVVVATPEAMTEVRKLGKVLGPRGLMPNPKIGTVTDDTAKAVKECKAGRVEFKLDRSGNVHVVCGRLSFDTEKLIDNARAVLEAIVRAKPSTAKGTYILGCGISATFSPSVRVDVSPFLKS